MKAIECMDLTKIYGKHKALNQVSFALEPNKFYGLLGRNGAGKTTLLHILNAELLQNSGTILVDGESPYENPKALDKLCFIKESKNFKSGMRINEVLQLSSYFYPNWDQEYALELLDIFQLDSKKKVKALSKGMESALGVTVGLASRAPVTVFDEPYIGMDAVARQMFYDLLVDDYMAQPRTIILSTHLIDEVSKLFEEVIMIDRGEILLHKDVEALRDEAFYVSGEANAIAVFSGNHNVIFKDQFSQTETVGIYGGLSDADYKKAKELNLAIEHMPLQKLMIHLTSLPGKGVRNHERN